MTSLVLPQDALKFVAGYDATVTLEGFAIEVGGVEVPVASEPMDVPDGAIVLVLPTGEPAPARPAEPPDA